MFINDVNKREEIRTIAKQHLRKYGIKYRDKTSRQFLQGVKSKKCFNVPLQNLENETVTLKNGQQLLVPKRLYEMCSFIFTKVETEGIFRKEGSRSRQNEIKLSLDRGCLLGTDHHVIDVAVVLKCFLRLLPEPLIPHSYQELFLRCSLVEKKVETLLLACLLLPSEHLNVLSFLMQFLHEVANHSKHNKMNSYNLSILVGPNIFPINEKMAPKNRLMVTKTCDIIRLLIENSRNIGLIPEYIIEQIGKFTPESHKHKVKRRRSGSLTRIFNGLKKIVGNRSDDEIKNVTVTPDLLLTPANSYTSKKHSEATKSLRRCKSKDEDLTSGRPKTLLERRWSTITQATNLRKKRDSILHPLNKEFRKSVKNASCESLTKSRYSWKKSSKESLSNTASKESVAVFSSIDSSTKDDTIEDTTPNYVRVSKTEYEDIKNRLSSIEKRLSLELDNVQTSMFFDDGATPADNIQSAYEKTLGQAEVLSAGTDKIARRLSRELRIRTADQKIIRSPSERRIGNIKRRSRELEKPGNKPRTPLSSPERKRLKLTRTVSSPIKVTVAKPTEEQLTRATSFHSQYKSTQITFNAPSKRFHINSTEKTIFSDMNLMYEDDFDDLNYQMFQTTGKTDRKIGSVLRVSDTQNSSRTKEKKKKKPISPNGRNWYLKRGDGTDGNDDKENGRGDDILRDSDFFDRTPKVVPHIKRSIVVRTPKRSCHTPNLNRNTPLKVLPVSRYSPNL